MIPLEVWVRCWAASQVDLVRRAWSWPARYVAGRLPRRSVRCRPCWGQGRQGVHLCLDCRGSGWVR